MRTIATVAARLNARYRHLPALIAMTDARRLPDPRAALAAMPRGAALIERTGACPRDLAALCRRKGVMLVIAGSATAACGADGLHLRDHHHIRAREIRAWRRRHGGKPAFAAVHSARALRAAGAAGADAVLLSPVFATASHPGAPSLGLVRFRLWVRQSKVPVYALGGITARTARSLLSTGCAGIAGIDWLIEPA